MLNEHQPGNLADGSARPRRSALAVLDLRSPAVLIVVFLLSAGVAAAYELVRSLPLATGTIWQSHELAIGLIALGSTAVFYFVRRAQEEARSEVDAERAKAAAGEKQFQLLFASNPLPMWLYDPESLQFVEVNEAAVRQYGYSRDEFLRMTLEEIRQAEDVPALRENLAQNRQSLEFSGPWRHRLKDGRVVDVEIRSHSLEWKGRDAVLVVGQDISARKRAETELEQRTAYLNALIENSPLGIVATDPEGRIQLCNPAFQRLFQIGPDEIAGSTVDSLIVPTAAAEEAYDYSCRAARGRPVHGMTRRKRKDGSLVDVELWGVPLSVGGRLLGTYGLYQDITDRKRAEEALTGKRVAAPGDFCLRPDGNPGD
jgi:PAS domain S-box-containing protein